MAHILLERTHKDFLHGEMVVQEINWTFKFCFVNGRCLATLRAKAYRGIACWARGIANLGMTNFRRCPAGDVLDSARHETFRTFSVLGWFVEFILAAAASFRDHAFLACDRNRLRSGGDGSSGLVALCPA